MKASAVASGKRRSMLPAPKVSGAGAGVAASKTGEVAGRKNKEATASGRALLSDVEPAGLNSTVSGSSSGSKGSVTLRQLTANPVNIVPGECHSGSESRQTQLRKPSNLQQPAVTHKRPFSASSVSNRVRELNHSSSLTKTVPDSVTKTGNSVKLTSVKRAAASADDVDVQSAETKRRGTTSVSSSRSADSSRRQKKISQLAEATTRTLEVPAKCVTGSTAVEESCSTEIVSESGSSDSQAETLLNAEQVVSMDVFTEITSPEETVVSSTYAVPKYGFSNTVEGGLGETVEEKCDSSDTIVVSSVPDILSRLTSLDEAPDSSEHLASSSGSLGILDDADLFDTSLLSFDCSSAPITGPLNEVEASCGRGENAPDEDTLSPVELSSSVSEIDPPLRSSGNEVNMPCVRPLSLMSNSSADMGIVADCTLHANESRCRQERPSSYMSTSSADTGYQAEDVEMVTVNSPSSDAETVLLYAAGVGVNVATSLAASSTSGSDTQVADSGVSITPTANVEQPSSDVDLCDNDLQQSSLTELLENAVSTALNKCIEDESAADDQHHQMMDALDIVNRNTADLTESWAVCRTQIETMQHAVEVVDDSRLVWTACGDCSNAETYDGAGHETVRQCAEQVEDATSKFSEPDNLEHMQGINSDTSASNYANEILCPSADVRDKSDQSTLNSAGSSARVPRNKQTSLGLKPQSVVTSESKEVVGSRKNVASRTPKKTENTSIGKKDGSSPNVTSRQPSMSSRGSFDVNSSRWSAPLSSRASSKQVDLAARRPSVPKQTARQPIVTGGSKQENQTRRKLSAVSASSRALLRDQKTASESSLAAGDFTDNLSSQASLRSSTPVTSSVGDSNDPSSISRVSSVSDASSPSASHGSSGALSASAFQSPKPSTGPVKTKSSATSTPARTVTRSKTDVASSTTKSSIAPSRRGTTTPEPTAVRKISTAKRGSVVEAPKIGPSSADSRRASVATVTSSRSTVAASSARGSLSRTNTLPSRPASAPKTAMKDSPKSSKNTVSSSRNVTSSRPMKQSPQPDVVSNSIADEHTSSEIGRLEVLCESKAKQLSAVSAALLEKTKWFEAMTVVAGYFIGQMTVGNEKCLADQLNEVMERLNAAGIQLDESVKQRDALISEIQLLKQAAEEERDKLTAAHQSELQQLEMELNARNEDALHRLSKQHSEHITLLEASYHRQMSDMQQNFDEQLAGKESEVNCRVDNMSQKHKSELSELQSRHEQQLEEITERFELIKVALSEKVEFLRTEGEELRRREKTYMEACQHDSEMRIQSSLAAYAQEIDSLKAVLELRNGELHDVRLRNMEYKRELEELTAARETIKRLQQKVENLEAIVSIRSDYEKQLTEKYQQLLRKYERESKANKRLSMDKEELMWRLSQGDPASDTLRRSLSRSPTGDPPTETPSPAPSTSLRPMSAVVLRPKKSSPSTQSENQPLNLRRSGTYDLLNQDIDDTTDSVFDCPAK